MFFVEVSVFLLFLGLFSGWMLLSDRLTRRQDARRAECMSTLVDSLKGMEITTVLARYGPPRDQFSGSTGRSIYTWRRPPSNEFPEMRGLVVITLTVNESGHVVDTAWQWQHQD